MVRCFDGWHLSRQQRVEGLAGPEGDLFRWAEADLGSQCRVHAPVHPSEVTAGLEEGHYVPAAADVDAVTAEVQLQCVEPDTGEQGMVLA